MLELPGVGGYPRGVIYLVSAISENGRSSMDIFSGAFLPVAEAFGKDRAGPPTICAMRVRAHTYYRAFVRRGRIVGFI